MRRVLQKINMALASLCAVGLHACKPELIDPRDVIGGSSEPSRKDHLRTLESSFVATLRASGLSQARVDQLRLTVEPKLPDDDARLVDLMLSWIEIVVSRLSGGGELPLLTVQVSSTLAIELVSEARRLDPEREAKGLPEDDLRIIASALAESWKEAKIPPMEILQGFALILSKSELLVGEMDPVQVREVLLAEVMAILMDWAKSGFEQDVGNQREAVGRALAGQAGVAQQVALVLSDLLELEEKESGLAEGREPILGLEPGGDSSLLCYAHGPADTFDYLWEKHGEERLDWKGLKVQIDPEEDAEYRCATRKKETDAPWSYSGTFKSGASASDAIRVAIEPPQPKSGDTLVCSPEIVEDVKEGEAVEWEFNWYRNGVLIENLLDSSIPGPLVKGDTWQCEAHRVGNVLLLVRSQKVSIGNAAPVYSAAVTAERASGRNFAGLQCLFPSAQDADGQDTLTRLNEIFVDGVRQLFGTPQTGASETLSLPAFGVLPGESVMCRSETSDGSDAVEAALSSALTIPESFVPIVLGGHAFGSFSEGSVTMLAGADLGVEVFSRSETAFVRVRRVSTELDSVSVAFSQSWMLSRSSAGIVEVFSIDRAGSPDPTDWNFQSKALLSRSGESFLDMALESGNLVLSSDSGKLYFLDLELSAGGAPFSESTRLSPSTSYIDLAIFESRLYALREDGFDIFDCGDFESPNLLSTTPVSGAEHLSVSLPSAFIGSASGVTMWDLSNLASPAERGTHVTTDRVGALSCQADACAVLDGDRALSRLSFQDPMSPAVGASALLPIGATHVALAGAFGEFHVSLGQAGFLRLVPGLTSEMASRRGVASFNDLSLLSAASPEEFLIADDFGLVKLRVDADNLGGSIRERAVSQSPIKAVLVRPDGVLSANAQGDLEIRDAVTLEQLSTTTIPSPAQQILSGGGVEAESFYMRLESGSLVRGRKAIGADFVTESEVTFESPATRCLPLSSESQPSSVVCSLANDELVLVSFAVPTSPLVQARRSVSGLADFAIQDDLVLVLGDQGLSLYSPHLGGQEWSLRARRSAQSGGPVLFALAAPPTMVRTFAVWTSEGVAFLRVDPSGTALNLNEVIPWRLRPGEESAPIRLMGERLFLGLRGTVIF